MPDFRTTFDDNVSRVRVYYTTKRVRLTTSWSPVRRLGIRHIGGWFCAERFKQGIQKLNDERIANYGALAAIDYIAEVYLPSVKTQTQPCGDVEQTLREAIGYEPTE